MARSRKKTYSTTNPNTGELLDIAVRPEVHHMARNALREQTPKLRRVARAVGGVALGLLAAPEGLAQEASRTARLSKYRKDAMMQTFLGGLRLAGAVARPVSRPAAALASKQVDRQRNEYNAAHAQAVQEYAAQNPEEVAKLREQARKRTLRETVDASMSTQHRIAESMAGRGRSARALIGNIPRRSQGSEGSYEGLAQSTLGEAVATQRREDGSIALLGDDVRRQHVRAAREAHTTSQLAEKETSYNEGIATALWKLGFVDTTEAGIPQGKASFNNAVRWSSDPPTHGEHGTTEVQHAQIPFDRTNDLHAMLLPEGFQDNPDLAVELELSKGPEPAQGYITGGEFMNLRVVPATVPHREFVVA